jgi:mRNA interferase MazF
VPLTEDASLAIAELTVRIEPTPDNGYTKTCFAVSPLVTGTSKARVRGTASHITRQQLADIRLRVAEAIGLG